MSRKLNHDVEYEGFTRDVEILLAENHRDSTIIVMSNGKVYRDKALLWATLPGIGKAVIAGKYLCLMYSDKIVCAEIDFVRFANRALTFTVSKSEDEHGCRLHSFWNIYANPWGLYCLMAGGQNNKAVIRTIVFEDGHQEDDECGFELSDEYDPNHSLAWFAHDGKFYFQDHCWGYHTLKFTTGMQRFLDQRD